MSLRALLGLSIVCAARAAAAERAIVVDAPGAPFAAAELAAAIRVRVAADGQPVRVRVTAIDRGVRVEAPGGARDVDLVGLRGAAAARLVALAANDLIDETVAEAVAPQPVRARGEAPALGVLGAVAGWDGMLGDVALDLTLPRDGWLIAIDAGGGGLVGGAVHLTTAVVRVDAGLRGGPFEARVGLVAAPVFVANGMGDATVLVGASASVRARLRIAPRLHAVLAAGGADAFATRTQYRIAGMAAASTPQLAPWLAAGVEVGL